MYYYYCIQCIHNIAVSYTHLVVNISAHNKLTELKMHNSFHLNDEVQRNTNSKKLKYYDFKQHIINHTIHELSMCNHRL